MTISHGEVRLEWECIDAIETTETTTTQTTTTTETTTTTDYDYDNYDGTTSGTTTTTDFTTAWDNSCFRHHAGHDEFRQQIIDGFAVAVESEITDGLLPERRKHPLRFWLTRIFDKNHYDITDEETQ